MGYQTNMLAKGLRAKRSATLAMVITDLTDPFFPELAEAAQRTSRQADYALLLASTQSDPDIQDSVIASLVTRGVDGLLVFPAPGSPRGVIRRIARRGTPVVLVDDDGEPEEHLTIVRNDLQGGARMAVDHLVAAGHRRISMVSNHTEPIQRRLRDRGYADAMATADLSAHQRILHGDPTIADGERLTAELLDGPSRPTAIFTYNDVMAIGALKAARSQHVAVPEQLSIVGFDDIALAQIVTPSLSTIRIDRQRLGQILVERLLGLIDDSRADDGALPPLAVELVVRDSSASAPQTGDQE